MIFAMVQDHGFQGRIHRQPATPPQHPPRIRPVWAHNLATEFAHIQHIRTSRPSIAIDTKFPGIIHLPDKSRYTLTPEERYALLKSNVDALKLIQVSLTLSNPNSGFSDIVWEFNLRGFNPTYDAHNPDSIDFLREHGMDFSFINAYGIDAGSFAQYMVNSGLLGRESQVSWIAFSGAYDFGFLLKILTRKNLPERMDEFLKLVELYFGKRVFDVKHLKTYCQTKKLRGGLEKVVADLEVVRSSGRCHNAGSDSLLSTLVWKKVRELISLQGWEERERGVLCGLQVC